MDSAKIMQQLNLMLRGKSESRNADQTPLKLRRMCLNDTGNVNHVERSPHFNFFGPRSMIFAADCSSFTQNQLHGSYTEVAAGIGLKRPVAHKLRGPLC